tara:strand:+ start:1136 stop:1378 length:243 start_codon:yes stop_codon:yes gene_type:complete
MNNIKMPGRKSLTKSDLVRAIQGLINHNQLLSQRLDDVDRILGDYITFNKNMDKFEEYLDGKYKQHEDEPSGDGSSTSKK